MQFLEVCALLQIQAPPSAFERTNDQVSRAEHPSVATLGYLAELYCNEDRYNEAEPRYQRAVVILERA
jgi:hypothetical protein